MKFQAFAAASLVASVCAVPVQLENKETNSSPLSSVQTDALAVLGASKLTLYLAQNGYPSKTCTSKNVATRKEWSALSSTEKGSYISAVKCLASKPAKTPTGLAAGAKNRYDDFVATHINQTLSIHGTGNFLSWHRYFTWVYEQALHNECGYTGYQPYYNWPKWASDPAKSPALDGSATSMSGDGAYVAGRANTCIPAAELCQISIPPGNGGGCITSGPFVDWKVNLGPVSPVLADYTPNPEFTGLGYNPRCLRRDISKYAASHWSNDSQVADLINNYKTFADFTTRMQGDFPNGFLGVHTAGHFTAGGDPGGDLFVSPGDPYFFLHHAMIDRTYWTWQNLDIKNRQYAIGATITVNNLPPSRNATLDDIVTLGYVGAPDKTIRDLSNTLAGPFCYIYV